MKLMLLLLSYHRRLRIISEAIEMRVEDGGVSHSWCICAVSYGYGAWWMVCMQDKAKGVGRLSGDAGAIP